MNTLKLKILILAFTAITTITISYSQDSTNKTTIELKMESGKNHNHPTFAIWLETIDGQYVQALFVTKSLATGTYQNADAGNQRWKREMGEARRPATLPYFLHKRGIKAPDNTFLPTPQNPIADAYTGATPMEKLTTLTLTSDKKLNGKYKILIEVNQPWDFNQNWVNNLLPENINYLTSGQPSLIYMVEFDTNALEPDYFLNPIGHGHPSGENGKLFTDISGFTTAKQIFKLLVIKIIP